MQGPPEGVGEYLLTVYRIQCRINCVMREQTRVLSFRVPRDIAEKVDKVVDAMPKGTVSKVLNAIFVPALDKHLAKVTKSQQTEKIAA